MGRYAAFTQRLLDSVLDAPGHTSSELRRAALARAARPGVPGDGLAAPLGRYVDTVARHAYKLTDDDLTALRRAGSSEDAIFEITVSAALGAALDRLERGLAPLRGGEPGCCGPGSSSPGPARPTRSTLSSSARGGGL